MVVKAVRGRDNVEGDDPTGLDAVAIKDEKTKTIRIIFQGSQGSMFNSKGGAAMIGRCGASISLTARVLPPAGEGSSVYEEGTG